MKNKKLKNVFYVGSEGQNQDELLHWIESCHPEFLEDEDRYTLEVEVKVTLIDDESDDIDDGQELVRRAVKKYG
jgi:hypothetical protein